MGAVTSAAATFIVSATTLIIFLGCCLSAIQSLPTASTSTSTSANRPPYVECVSSNECSFDSCCVLGMGRYSIPMCQKKLRLYEPCRPASDEPMNTTITYLDGQVVSLYNVHMIMCSCMDGLSCDLKTGRCVDFDGAPTFNDIYDNAFPDD